MIDAHYEGGTTVAAAPDPSPEQPSNRLYGYVVLWGVPTSIRQDGTRHVFARDSIVWTPNVCAYWTHDPSRPLASTAHKSLTLTPDAYGVRVEMDVIQSTTTGRDALAYVRSGLVAGLSIGGGYSERTAFVTPSVPGVRTFAAGQFIANHVAVVINPSMVETLITPTPENLAKLQKEYSRRATNQKLTQLRLSRLGGHL